MFGVYLIILLTLVSGVIAYLGDMVGHRIGRRRLSLFKLRPRHTSHLIAFFTGMTVSLVTLGVLVIVSQEARTALFGMEKVRAEIKKLDTEKSNLTAEKEKLLSEIQDVTQIASKGDIVFSVNQPIVIGLVKKGLTKENVRKELLALVSKANTVAIQRSNDVAKQKGKDFKLPPNYRLAAYIPADLTRAVNYLESAKTDQVVLLYSYQNVFLNMPVVVQFNFHDNMIVFRKNTVILKEVIENKSSEEKIFKQLILILSKVREDALKKGMILDPLTNKLGSISFNQLLEKSAQIKNMYGKISVEVITKEDVWTIGPLEVKLDLKRI